ncbi:MAG: hypothetical protein LUC18_02165 [Porphyromonadaceae bacterium]|nr:hypothetical protein [Porphyromonadaceae bacterium]
MKEDVAKRVVSLIKEKKLNGKKVAKLLEMPQSTFAGKLVGRSLFKIEELQKILALFPDISETWLLTGEGEMEKGKAAPQGVEVACQPPMNAIRYYPDVTGTLGGVEFADNPDEECQTITIPGYSDCTLAINAYGSSMQPLIHSGQILLLAEWKESFVDWGRIYLVVTKTGYRCVKRLFPSKDERRVVCRSEDREASPDFEIGKEEIIRLFLVKGWIYRDTL